uniref:meiosis 1 arrest protein n=1 Tax=Podarcis muralis TaxID=64176 RepID=UPI00109F507B|nr:meiosis 1 arrest protein [Podarcis muralis]XP_028600558.1 meiosis 1 arrest protein [Podarcis muralis]XP_028600559.1 meiosis 1 arrest protein [Podarcis muralis]XP_028600560.1 meiosis 1 arrest protein [Podarcis muralis]XP_028600561.1 meiosis 1 arrest protein [Podarcis muralis]XP_028600562.1 meiosis 1 arrest protein [Podarcis muralis]XP_028600563.1 meiosis 1 arrest protein [Podarcis muralis]XP_028600564.1 meiosis 1 arrest protein [Podarcis muralis]XP_028600565.1 meiosis 1 arrest protein [Po
MSSGPRGGSRDGAGKGLAGAGAASLSWQPPHILVVEAHPSHWAHTCHKLCDALENVFSLACSLAGPPRIPLLSLYVVQSQQECLLPFVPVRGSFSRLQSCLAELRALPSEGVFHLTEDAIVQAVQDGLQQFKQYTGQGMAGASLSSSSLEMTILTGQSSAKVAKQLEAGLQGIDLVSLRQLQVVEVSTRGLQEAPEAAAEDGEGATPSSSSGSRGESAVTLGAVLDLQTVENDVVALETFFKGWFHDHSPDQEHLHLLLPAGALCPPAAAQSCPVCVKCDAQERLLNPALLTSACGDGPTAQREDASGPFWMAAGPGLVPRKLRILRALEAKGLCTSLLYGLPLVIRPTSCWRMNWDELEANQQLFWALCHCLWKRNWLLLAKYETPPVGPRSRLGSPLSEPPPGPPALRRGRLAAALLPGGPGAPPALQLPSSASRASPGHSQPNGERPGRPGPGAGLQSPEWGAPLYQALRSSLGRPPPSRPERKADRHLPRQQGSRPHLGKARAMVAPLRMAPAAPRPPAFSLFSGDEEEFLDTM